MDTLSINLIVEEYTTFFLYPKQKEINQAKNKPAGVVTLRETLSEPKHKNLIALTFDDGYRDNLTVALPLLEKYGLPMTLFMAADFVGKEDYLTADDLKLLAGSSAGYDWLAHISPLAFNATLRRRSTI